MEDNHEIARAAFRLWHQAGRPPGRYIEFWSKVERSFAAARDAKRDQAELADGLFQVDQAAAIARESHTTHLPRSSAQKSPPS